MKILIVSSEVFPFAKTTELADFAGALPVALHKQGHDVRVITPKYKVTNEQTFQLQPMVDTLDIPISNRREPCSILQGELAPSVPVYFIKNDMYYQRDQLYGDSQGDYPDNAERFIYFSRSIPEICKKLEFIPDIIHCHDWQTGLVPVYLRQFYKTDPTFAQTALVYTIHRLGYQGLFWHYDMHLTGLGWELFTPDGLEYYGKINLMKGGLLWADKITTISKTYAQQIQTREYGHGLEGVFQFRKNDLQGLNNGVDYAVWNPETDPLIAQNYSPQDLDGKTACKQDLLQVLGLPEQTSYPLIGMFSQLDNQKGFDLVADIIDAVLAQDLYFVLLGTGHEKYQKLFQHLAEKYPKTLGFRLTYDDTLVHKLVAGADMFLMPSRHEPCGRYQIYSLKYGTVPIVRTTGGLKDTVISFQPDTGIGTGITFDDYQADALSAALTTAFDLYRNKDVWNALMVRGMAEDFSWDVSAKAYEAVYHDALNTRRSS